MAKSGGWFRRLQEIDRRRYVPPDTTLGGWSSATEQETASIDRAIAIAVENRDADGLEKALARRAKLQGKTSARPAHGEPMLDVASMPKAPGIKGNRPAVLNRFKFDGPTYQPARPRKRGRKGKGMRLDRRTGRAL